MKLISLAESLMEFASIEELDTAGEVEDIFKRHSTGPVWREISDTEVMGFGDFVRLQATLRGWLQILIAGKPADKKRLAKEIVRVFPDAAETAEIPYQEKETGREGRIGLKLIGRPLLAISKEGHIGIQVEPIITGVHAVVLHGMLQLFTQNLAAKIAQCDSCHRYYIKTAKLRVACSKKCKRFLRNKDVYRNLKRWRGKKTKKSAKLKRR